LDFGFGYIAHLRMLAMLGAHTTGVDVDQKLAKLYNQPGDQGAVEAGSVRVLSGRFPAEVALSAAVGSGYDLILSKNTLKRGYIHPEREADPKHLIALGVDDAAFLRRLRDALVPGGKVLLYNLCPAPAPANAPYVPWADGRSPFSREAWTAAGFAVIAFDENDDAAARAMAKAYGWDRPTDGEPGMDLERDLFAWWTLVEKR
jgi:hypothetical protein